MTTKNFKSLSLSQRLGGSMARGAYNEAEFPPLFNMSQGQGGAKPKKVKGGNLLGDEVDGGAVKKPKTKRKPSAYNTFIKANYQKATHLPPKERLGFLAKMWRESK
jgi:hypothetical protein